MDDIPSDFLASGSLNSAIRRLRGDLIGQQIGVYQITSLLGAGGMGEVYRARDTNLDRDVAIKVLPQTFVFDRERLARLRREAKVLASLNHPNIAAIHGLDESSGAPALVLELVEGVTLADRLHKGPVPIGDALNYARQIAEGLEAAHEKGIIHRDLKPANIKITPNATLKVLDFGLAKAPARGEADSSAASIGTRDGVIVGTVAYMSPEQARGQAVDKRSDIWAFGCVLFEMLTGRTPFPGETTSDTIAGVLEREPDWAALPDKTPGAVRRLLSRCLEKDPTLRLRDIGDARLEIRDAVATPETPREQRFNVGRPEMWLSASLLMVVSIAGALFWMMWPTRSPEVDPIRFSFVPPLMPNPFAYSISPDGRTVAIAARASSGPDMVFVRPLDSVEARPLPGTEGVAGRGFWSPDSRYLGFWSATSQQLKIVGLGGGPPRFLADVKNFGGGTWSSEDVIIFSDGRSLYRVPADGGTPIPFRNRSAGESAWWPQFLPDARRYLYMASDEPSKRAILVGSLDSDEISHLMQTDSRAVYVPPHFLVFMRQQVLLAQQFDASTLTLTGEPTVLAEGVLHRENGNAAFAVSDQGTLTYRAGGTETSQRSLVWIDRTGKSTGPMHVPFGAAWISLSPDGRRVAFSEFSRSAAEDVWVYDLERDQKVPLTGNPATDHFPVWSPDGLRVGFDSARRGARTHVIFERRADAATPEQILLPPESGMSYGLLDWTADFIVFSKRKSEAPVDIWAQRLSGDKTPFPYLQSLAHETNAALSPDGRWLAYVANQGGRAQVIVQSFPDAARRREQISRNGGEFPRWRRDGRELFYLDHDSKMIAVPVEANGTFAVAKSIELFTAPGFPFPANTLGDHYPMGYPYDVTSDGQRFLFSVLSHPRAPITVVVNWTAALRPASE